MVSTLPLCRVQQFISIKSGSEKTVIDWENLDAFAA